MAGEYFCNKVEFARFMGLSVRSLDRLIDQGMPVSQKGKKGKELRIDTSTAVTWYVEHKAHSLGFIRPDGGEDMEFDNNSARNLVYVEQHRKLKLENDKTEGELIPCEEVDMLFNNAITMLAGQLDGVAGRASSGDAVLRQKLLDEHRRIRGAYANALAAYAADQQGIEPDDAAAESGGVAVGEG